MFQQSRRNVLRNIKLLYLYDFFSDFRFYYPIEILYFSEIAGSYALGMMVWGVMSVSSSLFEVPTGIFSDYIGRRKTIILASIACVMSVFCYALGLSYWFLILGAVLQGLSRSFFSGNNEALLHDSLKEKDMQNEYHHFHGKTNSMMQTGAAISALAGGFLAYYFSYSFVFWLSLIPLLINLGLSFLFIEPKVKSEKSGNLYNHLGEAITLFIKNPKLRLLSFASIWAYGLGESGWLFRSAFVATIWPIWAVGIPKALGNIGAAFGFFIAGKVITKFKAIKALLFGSIFAHTINIIAFAFVTILSPIISILGSPIFGISETAKSTLFQKEFTDKQRATMGSLNALAGSLFFALASYSVGYIADLLDPAKGLLILQILMLVNIYIYWRLLKR